MKHTEILPPANIDIKLYESIRDDPEIQAYLELADEHLGAIGYTEHGIRHATRVGKMAWQVLNDLGYPGEECELARISGFLHDIGNFICRTDHGQTGAGLLYPILRRFPLSHRQLGLVLSAIGNHEEQYGEVYNDICAAVMIADKSDVHRSRVREYDPSRGDIHDDVNYAVTESKLSINSGLKEIRLSLKIDDSIASVMDYFEIFLTRMVMCRSAAEFLGCDFNIECNGVAIS
jgi:metal-dependent HD superfamily phosphatase/phosphodiesterase